MKSEVINNYFNDFNKFVYEVDGRFLYGKSNEKRG